MFNIATKNIKRNIKSYSLYIGATIFSIILYFTFATLKYSENISGLAETSKQIKGIMSASAFVLIIFVSIFILYSNTFFMKKRKKEIGLYSLLGVRKRTIGFLLFFENMMIGLISLIIGIGLGFLMAQLFLSMLLKMMGLSIDVGFAFSIQAVIDTALVFFLLFLITSLLGYRVIYKFRLIELFHAAKQGEKHPKTNIFAVMIGIISIGTAYWMALEDLSDSVVWSIFSLATPLIIIGLTVLGSYLLFNHVLVFILKQMKKIEHWSWKGLNMMSVSQLLYRIRANAKTLTIIATLSATTITAGGAVFGLYYSTEKNTTEYTPFTFMWKGEEQQVSSEHLTDSIPFHAKEIRIDENDSSYVYNVIDESTFITLAHALHWENIEPIKQDQVLLIDPFYDERFSTATSEIYMNDEEIAVQKLYDQSLFNIETLMGSTIVVKDDQFEQVASETSAYQAVKLDKYKNELALSNELKEMNGIDHFSSAVENYQQALQQSGVLLFVGSFLGFVFLLAMGSIIFFKMMTEAEEDKDKYAILYKIGVNEKEMKRTVRHQMLVIFVAPLLLGLLHGAVALTAFSKLLQMDLLIPVVIWMAAYKLIYIIYYFVTARGFYQTVQRGQI